MLLAMSGYYEKEKEFILECLGTPGFRDVFMWEVSKGRPLRWDGYRIAQFFNPDKRDFNAMQFLAAKLNHLAQTLRFPKNPIHEAAIYFWLWRRCFKSGDMACYPESPKDEPIRPAIDNNYSDKRTWSGQWTLFYLMYLDSLTWHFPDLFKLDPFEKNKEFAPREKYIFGEVCRQLCGVRTSFARVFHDRAGSEAEYRDICSHCAKKYWAERFHKVEKHPALVLALSFYANGFASFKMESNQKRDAEKLNADYLFDLLDRATNYRVFVPEEDWEARALFFILAQWLFLSDRRITPPTLEEHIFAILYLRFYRQGVDAYFKRESMSAIWDGIPYDKKEDVAVYYRRLLADTRNKAAEGWPNARISDYPEVDNGAVFGEVFHDLVRAKDYKRLDLLLKEDVVYAPYRNVELLWAASHSKRMFNRLLKVKTIPENEPPCIDKWEDALKADVIDGWRTLPFSELKWSKAAVRTILSDGVYSTLYLSASSSLLSSAVSDNSQKGIARLRAYVEVLGLDPREGKKDSECRRGADQNASDENGLPKGEAEGGSGQDSDKFPSLLEEAILADNEQAVAYLLEHGCKPRYTGLRWTTLGHAVYKGNLRIIKMLLDAGADPNHPTSGCNYYPAAWAIYAKRADILEMLIDAGARPFPQNNYCWYNLDEEATAFWKKQSPKVRQFVEAGMTKG